MIDAETMRLFLQIGLAAVLGLFVGVEREFRGKAAGMRTHALVCMGAALFTILSTSAFQQFGYAGTIDPSRIAAQVVVGIGFIGAGLIFVQRGNVHGLTTAAGLWTSAAIGMAVGVTLYSVAIFTTIITVLILWAIRKVERRIEHHDRPDEN